MRPTGISLLLLLIGFPLAVLPVLLDPGLWVFWLVYVGVVLAALGGDALLTLPAARLEAEVGTPNTLMIGRSGEMTVQLTARGASRPTTFEVLPELSDLLAEQPAQEVTAPTEGAADLRIILRPVRRGPAAIHRLWVRWTSPLGLIERKRLVALDRVIPIEPNVHAVRSAALKFFAPRDFASGLKVERYVGDGTEFDSLREYVPGLDPRAISWRATARHRRLICQDFRAERNHSVILAMDTGRLMCAPMDGIPKLDHGVTSALVLAYAALHTGDRVGFFAFDSKVRTYAEPQGGVHAFPRLRRLTADLEYHTAETNFTLGLTALSSRLRRRSLVILLTDFVDTVTAELMLENVQRLSRRHLVVFVTLRDPTLTGLRDEPPARLSGLYESVVAADFVQERERVIARLKRMGVRVLDVPPAEITVQVLNQYLEVKRRELI